MKAKKLMDETTNRYEYNRARKIQSGNWTWCRYHHGDNLDHKLYGDYGKPKFGKFRHPNWKLVSKNKKQWIKKPIKYKTKINWIYKFTEIVW